MSGYDSEAHHSYVDFVAMYLPRELNLPTLDSSKEFFSPPLPYMFPAFVQVICRNIVNSGDLVKACSYEVSAQIFQSFFILLLFFYLKIFKIINKENTN